MTPFQIRDAIKSHLDAWDGFWTEEEIWRHMHNTQQNLVRKISQTDPSFFVATADITITSGTDLYALPNNARLGSLIIQTEDRTNSNSGELGHAKLREYFRSKGITSNAEQAEWALQGRNLRMLPAQSGVGSIRVWYVPTYGNMIQGKVISATSTTVVGFESPNWTNNFGWVDPRDDYYNDMEIFIVSGPGEGQLFKISDYSVSDSVPTFTIDGTFSPLPTAESEFAVMSPVPEDHHDVIAAGGALAGTAKNRNRQDELRFLYYGHPGSPGLYHDMLSWVSERVEAEIDTVQPIDLGLF